MGLSKHIIFPLDNVEEVAQVIDLPKGDILTIGMNRFNGNVVMSYSDHPEARFICRLIVAQLANCVDMFDEDSYRVPSHGLIGYDDDSRYEHFYGAPPLRPSRCEECAVVGEVA